MFHNFNHHFRNIPVKLKQLRNSFSLKLTVLFLITLIVPLLSVSLIFYRITLDKYGEQLTEATKITSRQLTQQMESRLTQITKASSTLETYMLTFPNYLYGLEYNTSQNITEQLDSFSMLRTNINTLKSTFELKNISIFLDDSSFYSNEGLTFLGLGDLEKFNISEKYLNLARKKTVWLYVDEQKYPYFLSVLNLHRQSAVCMLISPNPPIH